MIYFFSVMKSKYTIHFVHYVTLCYIKIMCFKNLNVNYLTGLYSQSVWLLDIKKLIFMYSLTKNKL
jgi:hypothetical protein